MAGEWRTAQLGDICDFLTGFPFKSEHYVDDASVPRLLRGDNVAQGVLRWDGAKYWRPMAELDLSQYELVEGDVVLAMDRPWIEAGLKYASVRSADLPALLVQRVARLRGSETLESGYLRYVIGSPGFTKHVLAVQTGTAVPHISGNQIKGYEFPLPPLHEQRAIAHILGTLDDKIELNRRMNETLEAMACALFKSWFEDFEPVRAKAEGRDPGLPRPLADLFPARFVDSDLGEIPEGWTVKPMGDLADVVGGTTPSTTESSFWEGGTHAWATPKDLSSLSVPVLLRTERCISDAGLAQIGSGLLPAGTVLLSSRAPIGYLAIAELPVAINQGFIAMRPKADVSNLFLLLWTKASHEEIVSRANGSTFLEISKSNFKAIPAVTPRSAVMEAFDRLTRPLYDRLVQNEQESRTLAALRDSLLPKLISGELRVADSRRFIECTA